MQSCRYVRSERGPAEDFRWAGACDCEVTGEKCAFFPFFPLQPALSVDSSVRGTDLLRSHEAIVRLPLIARLEDWTHAGLSPSFFKTAHMLASPGQRAGKFLNLQSMRTRLSRTIRRDEKSCLAHPHFPTLSTAGEKGRQAVQSRH